MTPTAHTDYDAFARRFSIACGGAAAFVCVIVAATAGARLGLGFYLAYRAVDWLADEIPRVLRDLREWQP